MTTEYLRDAQLDVLFKRSQRKAFTSVNTIFSREKINFTQFSRISTLWLDSDKIPVLPPDSESSIKIEVDKKSTTLNNTESGLYEFAGNDVVVKYIAVPLVPVPGACFDVPSRHKQSTGLIDYTANDIENMIRDFTVKGCNFFLPDTKGINVLQHSLQPADTLSGVYKVRIFFNTQSTSPSNLIQNLGQSPSQILHIDTAGSTYQYTDATGNVTEFTERGKWGTRSTKKYKTLGSKGISANPHIGSEILPADYFYQVEPNSGILSFLEFPSPEINATFPPVAFFYRYEGRIGLNQTSDGGTVIEPTGSTSEPVVPLLLDVLQDQLNAHLQSIRRIKSTVQAVTSDVQIKKINQLSTETKQHNLPSYLKMLLQYPVH